MSRIRRSGLASRSREWATAAGLTATLVLLGNTAAATEPPPSPPALGLPATVDATGEPPPAVEDSPPEEPASATASPLVLTGYVDVGFAKAQGNGTSYPATSPSPADYYVDTFAPAVNSRGEVASVIPPAGSTVDGFYPRTVGIGGKPSFLLNTASVDIRYTAPDLPVLVFTRLQVLPRLEGPAPVAGGGGGENTRLVLDQAFGRITPIRSAELAITIGKFDSVFGIEYLENQANFRVGITPSLIARYTTGPSVGAKLFYRAQIVAIASAVSVNVAATNSGTFVEALQGPSRSLTGVPVATARLGYELNLERVSFKLGASISHGPRNDQTEGSGPKQTLLGVDARLLVPTLTVTGEFVHIDESEASGLKLTGQNTYAMVTEFYAKGFYVQAAEELPLPIAPFRITLYGRYDHRSADFEGYSDITVDRITGGLNVGIGDSLQVKAEYLVNRELEGAPTVPNDVFASSVVWTW